MSNTSKQLTAVEWLINEINKTNPEVTWALRQECSKALAMEKEHIKSAHIFARLHRDNSYIMPSETEFDEAAENYYNSLYGKEEKQ